MSFILRRELCFAWSIIKVLEVYRDRSLTPRKRESGTLANTRFSRDIYLLANIGEHLDLSVPRRKITMKGRRNAILPADIDQDSSSIITAEDHNIGPSMAQTSRTQQPLRLPSPAGWERTREPGMARSRTVASTLNAKGKPSGIPRPTQAVSKAQKSPPLPPKQADTASSRLVGGLADVRHGSMDLSASTRGSRTRGSQIHSRTEPKIVTSASRSKSVAIGASNKSRAESRVSISSQRYGEDQLWYEVGTPTPSPRNKRLSTVEKHKEAFETSLAQGSSAQSTGDEVAQF